MGDDILKTPTMKRVIEIPTRNSSPSRRSPTKSILISPTKLSPVKLSPVKTPRGRAGLKSPTKRSLDDLTNSAVRRAYKTKISSVLADEDTFDEDEAELDRQDLELAETIIDQSKNEDDWIEIHGRNVKLEEDPSEGESADEISSRRTRRARQSRTKYAESLEEFSEDDSVDGSEILQSTSDEDEELSDNSDEDPVVPEPRLKKRRSPEILSSPSKRGPKKGFNQREELLKIDTERILSIFKQDDEQFKSQSPKSDRPKTSPKKEKDAEVDLNLLLKDEENLEAPIITGIPETEDSRKRREKRSLNPLPIPKVGSDGSLSASYIQQYLLEIRWETSKTGEALDDRSFFFDGPLGYFDQMSHRERHSVYSLSNSGIDLSHGDFVNRINLLQSFQEKEKLSLQKLYQTSYHQWSFEASQGYNLCYYGVGSKIEILNDFVVEYLASWIVEYHELEDDQIPKVFVLNGYTSSCSLRDILEDLINSLVPEHLRIPNLYTRNMADALPLLFRQLKKGRPVNGHIPPRIILLVHCIDLEYLREEKTQLLLCQLASIPEVLLVCSTENVSVPLLWDLFKVENYNFVYHNLTTYEPYLQETFELESMTQTKSKKTTSSRGAKFVLTSLNKNFKKIYHTLLTMQMDIIKQKNQNKTTINTSRGTMNSSVNFREFHEKCIEHFITSNEISFRAMVGEFVEHHMCKIVKDEAGVEKIIVGYTMDEMSKLLLDCN